MLNGQGTTSALGLGYDLKLDWTSNATRCNANPEGTSASTEREAPSRDDSGYDGRISEIWKSLLGLPHISIDDNFFEVGGTSLLATVLLKRLNAAFQRELIHRHGL